MKALFQKRCIHLEKGVLKALWWFLPVLVPVAETDWKFEPMLAGKGSSGPGWFNVLGNQALHIHFCFAVMNPQEVPAGFESFRKVYLIFIFCIAAVDVHSRYDGGTVVVQNGPCPYFLYDVLIFFRMECFET